MSQFPVNWVMKQSGYEGTNSSWAKDWKKWGNGKIISKPVYGAIFVIDYNYKPIPPDKDDNGGHVGFVVGQEGRSIWVLGGNQGGSKKEGHHRGRVQVSKYHLGDDVEGWYSFVVPKNYEDNSVQLGPYKEEADVATRESTL